MPRQVLRPPGHFCAILRKMLDLQPTLWCSVRAEVKQMNIKQASEQSGVSAPNIRFYEKEGLLTPARRQGNDYRDYTAGDVRTLKLIRMLRMLDVPLPVIQRVLNGEQPLSEALQAQQEVLEQQAAQLAGAIRFCAELTQQAPQVDQLDVDDCLKRMQDRRSRADFSPAGSEITVPWQKTNRKNAFSSYRNSPSTPRRILQPCCCAMGKLKGAPSASQKGECTRSLSGTVSGIRHGAGRAAIAILSAAKRSSRNLSKQDCRPGGNACCAGCGGCSLWQ